MWSDLPTKEQMNYEEMMAEVVRCKRELFNQIKQAPIIYQRFDPVRESARDALKALSELYGVLCAFQRDFK